MLGTLWGAGQKEEVAKFTGEPDRNTLTEPPPGYQTPSPNFAYGVGQSYKDKGKASNGQDPAAAGSPSSNRAAQRTPVLQRSGSQSHATPDLHGRQEGLKAVRHHRLNCRLSFVAVAAMHAVGSAARHSRCPRRSPPR